MIKTLLTLHMLLVLMLMLNSLMKSRLQCQLMGQRVNVRNGDSGIETLDVQKSQLIRCTLHFDKLHEVIFIITFDEKYFGPHSGGPQWWPTMVASILAHIMTSSQFA